ncbi:guanylate kinase [Candidatus Sulfidibacterium hydrothermale]|uniref:guanylate kinase n=1 Tax=Candidatus Sulfidibacterium hydrothermale TaxID=2875962 RepID=UPI001F0A7F98|nr:guanylate kinase [Candidatus Sulfidibacterium hydrothermale]UBM61436.1 guanylate kinase [Candidatus Sulfidibacterium hydrothermale]
MAENKVQQKGKLIIFSAPSGSGKTTLVHYVMAHVPHLAFSVSATSRPPRPGEKDGVDYYFLSVEEFKKKIKEGAFVEWEEVYENQFYGTLRSEVERIRNRGDSVVFDVDVKGGVHLKEIYGNNALSVFVKPPSLAVLEQRLRHRSTETEESLRKRLDRAAFELTFEPKFDKVIVNDVLEKAQEQAVQIVRNFLETERV